MTRTVVNVILAAEALKPVRTVAPGEGRRGWKVRRARSSAATDDV